MDCPGCESASGHYQCSWDDNILLDYPAHGDDLTQPAPPCPVYDTAAPATTASVTLQGVQHGSVTSSSLPVETVLDSGNGNRPWTSALSIARPPLPGPPRIAEATIVNLRAFSSGPSTPFTVPVMSHAFVSQSHLTLVRTDVYEGEESGVITYPALCEGTLSLRTL